MQEKSKLLSLSHPKRRWLHQMCLKLHPLFPSKVDDFLPVNPGWWQF